MRPACVCDVAKVGECERSAGHRSLARVRLGQAEVQHLHRAVGRQLDVGGLEIAMDDSGFVGLLERGRHLCGNLDRFIDREWPACQPLGEVFARHELHREEIDRE
jgi:hypothetical protein